MRLTAFIRRNLPSCELNFNSTLVRLTATPAKQTKFDTIVFQFHIGAINRLSLLLCSTAPSQFQFHIGAINSGLQGGPLPCSGSFQFHIGAINSALEDFPKREDYLFQFHIGAINRVY